MRRIILIVCTSCLLAAAGGCSEKLETGYEPRRLGSSSEVRRGFYAAPFTPEARKAREYEQSFGDGTTPVGRPKPGY
jgi:hypothetical protein